MLAIAPSLRHGEGHLWMIALAVSLLANVGILAMAGVAAIRSEQTRRPLPAPAAAAETLVMIMPQTAAATPVATPAAVATAARPRFARTSPDQTAEAPRQTPFIGERNTRATSERRPVAAAPPLPSQAGITPRAQDDIETTQSEYREGSLDGAAQATPQSPSQPTPPPAPASLETAQAAAASLPPPREKLLEGPHPVEVPVPRETAQGEALQPTPEPPQEAQPAAAAKPAEESPPAPKPAAPRDPAFSGFQRKTALVGSISRTGRSSLEVADTPLGRYQAVISRAVEQEWQRNCVRHRDFITPGFLTMRFFVETSGRVRSVQFVGDMETGEVQKGFTLNSIRDAEIPPMPPPLRRDYASEPLELIFRFYF